MTDTITEFGGMISTAMVCTKCMVFFFSFASGLEQISNNLLGRADFLCMQLNGVITGYLNKGVGNMLNQGQIKHSEGKERRNLRLADINGDGRDE